MTDPDPDRAARRRLGLHRLAASLLLLAMAGLMFAARLLPPGHGAALLGAAARAGLIGGLADWFAITALFRRPLGLPIPHTAILPRQKARLGAALGRFVAQNVFTEQDVASLLAGLDTPALLSGLLRDPQLIAPLAATIGRLLPTLLAGLEDGRARRLIERMLPRLLGGRAGGVVLARALRGLVAGGRHQDVFSFVLDQLRRGMAGREEVLRLLIEDRVREQGGRLIGWALGASVARRVLAAVNTEFETMEPTDSDLRIAFDEWVRREIDRIETDPDRAIELGAAIGQVFAHPTIRVWFWDVWRRLAATLGRDAADPASRTRSAIGGLIAEIGDALARDPSTGARINAGLAALILRALPGLRLRLADFIARVVAAWDDESLTTRLELRVGPDLQFVRINGTLVGFVAGLALAALLG